MRAAALSAAVSQVRKVNDGTDAAHPERPHHVRLGYWPASLDKEPRHQGTGWGARWLHAGRRICARGDRGKAILGASTCVVPRSWRVARRRFGSHRQEPIEQPPEQPSAGGQIPEPGQSWPAGEQHFRLQRRFVSQEDPALAGASRAWEALRTLLNTGRSTRRLRGWRARGVWTICSGLLSKRVPGASPAVVR